jgi:hypothetical protein
MRNILLAGGLIAALAIPAVADAQTRCERDRSTNRAVGTVVGAGIGALLGSAIAGNSSNTAGAIVGGVAGGVAGNQIAKNAGEPCPTGYYEVPTVAPAPGPGPGAFWTGAPVGIRERIDYMQRRIDRADRNRDLSRREAEIARDNLASVRRMEVSLRRRDGGRLTAADREYLQTRLDDVGRSVRWMQRADVNVRYNRR